jgi:hypothetical protein
VESYGERFRYIGNCTDRDNAPYLQDMMDQAKKVRYQEVYGAVGRDALAEVFGDFYWGNRPNRYRGDMALHQDPYVSFYKSSFRGYPCYYVKESGIEYIFLAPAYFDADWDAPQRQKNAKRYYINTDGSVTAQPNGAGTAVSVAIANKTMQVVQSSALNAEVATALLGLLDTHRPKSINDDGEPTSVDDYRAFVTSYL